MRRSIPLLVLLVTTGCGPTRHTVGDGAFQKRRLRTGWHVDLGFREKSVARTTGELPQELPTRTFEPAISAGEPISSATGTEVALLPLEKPPVIASHQVNLPAPSVTEATDQAHHPAPHVAPGEVTKARWNPWSVPAFLLALGTVAYALLGTSELIVVLAVVATLVLASIAVRKGRTYEWRGKGFAVAALIIGSLAALVTLVALLVG